MSAAVQSSLPSLGLPMDDTMARPHPRWDQDPYSSRQSAASRVCYPHDSAGREQLPGPASLFSGAATVSSSSALLPHPRSSHLPIAAAGHGSPPYLSSGRPPSYAGGAYATPSPVGQTPPQFPTPNTASQSLPAPPALRTNVRGLDSHIPPAHSPVSSVRSDNADLAPRHQQQPRYHSREPPACHYRQPPAPASSPPHGHASAVAACPTTVSRSTVYPAMHASSPRPGPGRLQARSISPRTEAKQMSITSLLTEESAARSAAQPQAPIPCRKHPTTDNASTASKTPTVRRAPTLASSEYRIHVRQQPVAARSCGFGERDRRVIDPPPIVQLAIDDPEATPEEIGKRLRFQFTVLHCSIWNETGEQDNSAMPEDYRQQRRLMGTLVSSPFVGQDENGEEGCFFCFPDLSCRTPGTFRLKFALVVLDPLGMRAGGSSPIMATAMSAVFTVYNAKDFPGMQASTALTKRLKEQGCLISIKKGSDKAGASHGRDESGDDDSARDGAPSGKGRKRAKRG